MGINDGRVPKGMASNRERYEFAREQPRHPYRLRARAKRSRSSSLKRFEAVTATVLAISSALLIITFILGVVGLVVIGIFDPS